MMMSCFFLFGYIVVEHFDQVVLRVFPTEKQESARAERALLLRMRISDRLDKLLIAGSFSRIVVSRYHNNTRDFAGNPFDKSTNDYIKVATGYAIYDWEYNTTPAQVFDLDFNLPISKSGMHCVATNTVDMKDAAAKQRYAARGIQKFVSCPILAYSGVMIGLINGQYNDLSKQILSDSEAMALVDMAARQTATDLYEMK